MISITGQELFDMMQVFPKFCADYKFSVKIAYRLARIFKTTESEFKVLDAQRIDLIKKYGEEIGDGQFKIVPESKENFKAFQRDMEELLKEKIEIPFNPIDINDMNGIDIAPAHFAILDKIFTQSMEPDKNGS